MVEEDAAIATPIAGTTRDILTRPVALSGVPFLFADTAAARGAMDGALGQKLARAIEEQANYRILGWFENGFRHISNKVGEVRRPADLAGIRIRVLPSEVGA